MRLIPPIALLFLLLPVPARAEAVLYTNLSEHDGFVDVDGYLFWPRSIIIGDPLFFYEQPPALLFHDGERWTYYDGLRGPGADVDTAWIYRDLEPVDNETEIDASGHLLYVEHDEHTYQAQAVPEPATLLLSALGMGAVMMRRRRRRRNLRALLERPQRYFATHPVFPAPDSLT